MGTNANDQLNGMAGNDVIDGGGGADTITGGLGFDTLTGGAGPDVFRYNSIAEAAVSQSGPKETITDFDYTQDVISFGLVNGVFNFVSSTVGAFTGDSTNTEAMFDNATDTLTVDVDGDGTEDMEIVMTNVNEADLNPTNLIFV